MKYIVFYPGRFQPFALHHKKAVQYLNSIFGPQNVYIISTNSVDSNSPLNYNERIKFINKSLPNQRVAQVKNLFSPIEILNDENSDTIAIFCYSKKDAGRISFFKVDGSPSYFKPFISLDRCESYLKTGYIFVIPEFKIKFKNIYLSGSEIRNWIKNIDLANTVQNIKIFKDIFGFFDKNLFDLLIKKIKK